ncbi:MAG: thiolase C-terminal domain-containing protein [Brevefilum sp.]|jgi:acetyl-CoA C-acetyltransferase
MENNQSDVVIAGIGQTPVGERWDVSLRELAAEAILPALKDSGGLKPDVIYIGNMLAASASRQANLGALLAEDVGLNGIEAVTVEAADASGGAALRMAYMAIVSGAVDVALAVGVEKCSDVIGSRFETHLSQMLDADYEAAQGLTPISLASLLFNRYLYENTAEHSHFGGFPEVAHANAVSNAHAMFRSPLSGEHYQAQAQQSEKALTIYDLAPFADGAAAVLLTREDKLPRDFSHIPVRVIGSSLVADSLSIHDRNTPLVWDAARISIERACRSAGIMPKDLDFFEYHDATSLHAAISLEMAGFAPIGKGWTLANPAGIGMQGQIPVATFGGLKARGHPLGATGVYQAVEAALQIRGEAGKNQVPDARVGLIQSLGGMAATAVAHVLSY